MRKWWMLLCIPLLLCGCERGEQVDPVLFCAQFNRRAAHLHVREEDALYRGDGEMMLWADGICMRLLTNEDSAVHTVVITSPVTRRDDLLEAAETAFGVLSSPLGEQLPADLPQAIRNAGTNVQTIRTQRFVYLVFALPECVSVMQINSSYSPLPERPTLRRPESE